MRSHVLVLAAALHLAYASPVARGQQQALQVPSWNYEAAPVTPASRKLHGRFLHITDLHADPFYKIHASTEEESACHRGSGSAGIYGAETSDCDSPYALLNETFKWIETNLRDTIDFVVWTGDSARHDSDEDIPRSSTQVMGINKYIAGKFEEVFGTGKEDKGNNEDLIIPIVPNFGNNDILPHNIMLPGPNKWLKSYTSIWSTFIPEEQRHGFERGGWFYVEVIPKKLAVFSLNTLYFFDSNSAVDGCALRSEPGFEQMEWLRIQLGFMRQRGMKAILMGHVPPARTDSKRLWDETCWQKYTLWLQQYRDVVITGLYGHMNVDHFVLQDTKDIDLLSLGTEESIRTQLDDELTIESAADYLEELREGWSKLPKVPVVAKQFEDIVDSGKENEQKKHKKEDKKDKAVKKIGGPWGERYQMSSISPSIVPNFFPTLRVIEYNITGLDDAVTWFNRASLEYSARELSPSPDTAALDEDSILDDLEKILREYEDEADSNVDDDYSDSKKKKKDKKKPKKPKNPDLIIPPPPTKGTPPGPGYSPQPLTLLGYTQYFANLTHINNDYNHDEEGIDGKGWHEGKHKNKPPKEKKPHPKKFKYEVEYSTFNDSKFGLQDMTVKSYLKLAKKIGRNPAQKKSIKAGAENSGCHPAESKQETNWSLQSMLDEVIATLDHYKDLIFNEVASDQALLEIDSDADAEMKDGKKGGKKHKKKKHHKHKNNKTWLAFVKRAFVGTMTDEEVERFQVARAARTAEPASEL